MTGQVELGADRGRAVLVEALDAYRNALGERLVAAYALGSLAHGGFSLLVSDVDLGLILADPVRPTDSEVIESVEQTRFAFRFVRLHQSRRLWSIFLVSGLRSSAGTKRGAKSSTLTT